MLVYYNEFPAVCKVFFYSTSEFSCGVGISGDSVVGSAGVSGVGVGVGVTVVSSGSAVSGATVVGSGSAAGVSGALAAWGVADAAAGSAAVGGVGSVVQTPVWAVKVTSAVRESQAP